MKQLGYDHGRFSTFGQMVHFALENARYTNWEQAAKWLHEAFKVKPSMRAFHRAEILVLDAFYASQRNFRGYVIGESIAKALAPSRKATRETVEALNAGEISLGEALGRLID